jgi:hypothetical protein
MKEQWEQECADLRAELAALQKKLHALETNQGGAIASAPTLSRWRLSKRMMMVLLPVVALLAAGGVLYGQGAMDALFIDKDGKVGIGTTTPSAKLEVSLDNPNGWNGNLRGLRLLSPDKDYALDVNAHVIESGNVGYHFSPNNQLGLEITTPGNVGIGTMKPEAKLDVRGKTLVQSLSFTDGSGTSYADNWVGMADNILEKTKWLHIGGITDEGKRRIALFADTTYVAGRVGIGTTKPDTELDVAGAIKATSVNGEKPPMVFEVGQKDDTQKWYAVNKDIKDLCGDADGCTMKFFLRSNNSDEVRTISEQIYIEQPDKSSNKQPGLHGWARQLGGGDQAFILQTANKYEIVPHPWGWIWVLNYSHQNVGQESGAFSGYQVQFMTAPNVSATVIIYDR